MLCNNVLHNLLAEYKLKKEEEINNLKTAFEKNISTERTLKTQVHVPSALPIGLHLNMVKSEN